MLKIFAILLWAILSASATYANDKIDIPNKTNGSISISSKYRTNNWNKLIQNREINRTRIRYMQSRDQLRRAKIALALAQTATVKARLAEKVERIEEQVSGWYEVYQKSKKFNDQAQKTGTHIQEQLKLKNRKRLKIDGQKLLKIVRRGNNLVALRGIARSARKGAIGVLELGIGAMGAAASVTYTNNASQRHLKSRFTDAPAEESQDIVTFSQATIVEN